MGERGREARRGGVREPKGWGANWILSAVETVKMAATEGEPKPKKLKVEAPRALR